MHSKILFAIILFLKLADSHAQPGLIVCSSKANSDNTVSIYADSRAQAEYTIKVTFTSLSGYSTNVNLYSDIALVNVTYGRKEIIRLTRLQTMMTTNFQYKYQYFPGLALRKPPDSSFLYLMPTSAGNHVRPYKVSSITDKLGINTSTDYFGMGFILKLGDTICASRAGTVFEVIDTVSEGEKKLTYYKSGRNKISIEHRDGSLGNYTFVAPIKLLVSPGEEVIPGQPLAVFNKESEKYNVSLSTLYLDQKKLLADAGGTSYSYVPLHFYAGENDPPYLQPGKEYEVKYSPGIIAAELSKKEKKKLGL